MMTLFRRNTNGDTLCTIKNGEKLFFGVAKKNKRDRLVKAVGRKCAEQRALYVISTLTKPYTDILAGSNRDKTLLEVSGNGHFKVLVSTIKCVPRYGVISIEQGKDLVAAFKNKCFTYPF